MKARKKTGDATETVRKHGSCPDLYIGRIDMNQYALFCV